MPKVKAGPVDGKAVAGQRGPGSIGWDSVIFLAVCCLTLFARFRTPDLLLGSYQDDFFYYLKVAQNIATTGVSTFNGLNLTNGYHPLWMALLACLYWLFHGTAFFVALQLVSLLSAAATYLLMRRVLRFYLSDIPSRCGAFALGMEALFLIRYGMEVTLTLPLAMLLIYLLLRDGMPQSAASATRLGFVSSLVILSRLDAGLLVALLCLALVPPLLRTDRFGRIVLAFCCGVCPLLCLYFAINVHVFHLLTPVSGLAKQMKTGFDFSRETWLSLLPNNRMQKVVVLPELITIGTGMVVALSRPKAEGSAEQSLASQRVLWCLLLFPCVHLCTLSLLSDWNVWPWYFYSLSLASLAAYAVLAPVVRLRGIVTGAAAAYACVLVVYAAAYAWKGPSSVTVYQSSLHVAQYMDAHPGVYMMGDQAGTTAYLSHQPIIQTEGLVMDKHFLQLMRAGTRLPQIAKEYHATYFAKIGGAYQGSCMLLTEPANAGPTSPMMRGTICHAPLAVFYREADHMPIRIFEAGWIQ